MLIVDKKMPNVIAIIEPENARCQRLQAVWNLHYVLKVV